MPLSFGPQPPGRGHLPYVPLAVADRAPIRPRACAAVIFPAAGLVAGCRRSHAPRRIPGVRGRGGVV
jgi:hypothetical protein